MTEDSVRVVVVDDDADVADALAMQLTLDGYQVSTALSAQQAVLCIESMQPHCVLIDIAMPDIDGYELACMLRHRFKDDVVLVAITGSSASEARVKDTFAVVDHYFQKPLHPDALRKVLRPLSKAA